MKGEILEDGRLAIVRGGRLKAMDCRFCTAVTSVTVTDPLSTVNPAEQAEIHRKGFSCADHCPHFGEPVESSKELTQLTLCHGTTLNFNEFKDRRKPAPNLKLEKLNE